METNKKVKVNLDKVDQAELERIALAKELGNNLQDAVKHGMTPRQKVESGEWKYFRDRSDLADYLAQEYKLWIFGRKGLFNNRISGNQYRMGDHLHTLEDYPQRIPYGVLLKIKEAKECGLERFCIIDPEINATQKGSDPFLIGQFAGTNWVDYYLICNWDDKKA